MCSSDLHRDGTPGKAAFRSCGAGGSPGDSGGQSQAHQPVSQGGAAAAAGSDGSS